MKFSHRFLYQGHRLLRRVLSPTSIGVRVMLLQNDQVVLVKHTYRPHWFFPGGGVKHGETLEQAARREAREEAGATLGAMQLFGVYVSFANGLNDHVVLFLCQNFSYTGESDWEIAEVRSFPLDQLPEDLSPGSRRRLADWQAGGSGGTGLW